MTRAGVTSFVVALGLSISCGDYLLAPPTTATEPEINQPQTSPADYVMLSKKGLAWRYNVAWEIEEEGLPSKNVRRLRGKITIVNEGEELFEGERTTVLRWYYDVGGPGPQG